MVLLLWWHCCAARPGQLLLVLLLRCLRGAVLCDPGSCCCAVRSCATRRFQLWVLQNIIVLRPEDRNALARGR